MLIKPNHGQECKVKISELFFPPPYTLVPLCTIIHLEKRDDSEIIAAESLVALVKVIDKREVEIKVNKVIQEVLQPQLLNEIYSQENLVANDVWVLFERSLLW